jgi:dTDP-4-dehydrorhamnose 3,5-epimerase
MRVRHFAAMEGFYLLEQTNRLFDDRGRIYPSYEIEVLKEQCGADGPFVTSEMYYLSARALAGFYYQEVHTRGSLFRCLYGKAQIVGLDMRANSKTFGKSQGALIDSTACAAVYAKPGFATAILAVGAPASVVVEHSTYTVVPDNKVIRWDDPTAGVIWAGLQGPPILGQRERAGKTFGEILPYRE